MIVLIFNEELLVDVGGLLEMASEIMKSSHTKLILNRV
jgi:hypothetical protein